MSDHSMHWKSQLIRPGTTFPDDAAEVPPGWYVVAYRPEDDPDDGARVAIHVAQALSGDDFEVDQEIADRVAILCGYDPEIARLTMFSKQVSA